MVYWPQTCAVVLDAYSQRIKLGHLKATMHSDTEHHSADTKLRRLLLIIRAPAATISALVLGWTVLILLVNPSGAFPLNDDWSYSRAVEMLINHGRLQFTGFTSMTLIAQVLWGALFSVPFGFSFLALRLSTLVLGALGIIAVYLLMREMRANRQTAFLAASVVALNPLYFSLSFTFMTDVPFVAVSMLSLLFYVRAFRSECREDIVLGHVLAAVAILIRQNAVVLPVAFAIAYLLRHKLERRTIRYAFVPLAFDLLLVAAYPIILAHTIGLPFSYISARRIYGDVATSLAHDWLHLLGIIGDRLLVETLYLGLFTLPVAILVMGRFACVIPKPKSARGFWTGASIASSLAIVLLLRREVMPVWGNVLYDVGLGPPLLRDTYVLRLHHLPSAPRELWIGVTIAAVIGSASLVMCVVHVGWQAVASTKNGESSLQAAMLCVWIVGVGYVLNTAVTTSTPSYSLFDRYFVFALAPLMMLLAHDRSGERRSNRTAALFAAIALMLTYGVFSVAGTHDYLAWNRARWRAANDLLRQGISAQEVNGGFEFNGWYKYDQRHPINSVKSLWSPTGEYMLAFGPVKRYRVIRRYSYRRWMPLGWGTIVVLRRCSHVGGEMRCG